MPLPQSRIGRVVLLGIVLGLLLVFAVAASAAAEQRTHLKGVLPFEHYAAHQEYFRWCLERGLDLYDRQGEENLNTALRRWDNPVWTEARDAKGRVWLFISPEYPVASFRTGDTVINFLGKGLEGRAFMFGLVKRTPQGNRRVRAAVGPYGVITSYRPDARTLAHLRYWADTPSRIQEEKRLTETPDDILFRPRLDVSLAFPIAVTGAHREFPGRSDQSGTWLTAFSLGGHMFETRDQRLLVGGLSTGAYVSRNQGGWGLQLYPLAIRLWRKCPIAPLYAAPTYTRVWANQRPVNLVGLQFLLTGDTDW